MKKALEADDAVQINIATLDARIKGLMWSAQYQPYRRITGRTA